MKIAWLVAIAITLFAYHRAYLFTIESPARIGDFFQEWASARCFHEGLPVYTPQAISAWKFLGRRLDDGQQVWVKINGHPPACILTALPLGRLDYVPAFYLWNFLSCVCLLAATLVALHLETGRLRTWLWLPLLTMLLSNSFAQHLILGQVSVVLLLLIVGVVYADDRGRPVTAGLLLGTATAIKLFPGLLFLYFVLNRQWRTVIAGVATVALFNLACLALFGVQAYDHFLRYSIDEVLRYRDWWGNFTITGMWFKLFAATSGQSTSLWHAPTLARVGAGLTTALLIVGWTYVAFRCRHQPAARQSCLALLITAMILATPIAWDHYFLILLWPMLHTALRLPKSRLVRVLFSAAAAVLWLNPLVPYVWATGWQRPATPAEIVFVLSWPFFAILAIYGIGVRLALRESASPVCAATEPALRAPFARAELRPVS